MEIILLFLLTLTLKTCGGEGGGDAPARLGNSFSNRLNKKNSQTSSLVGSPCGSLAGDPVLGGGPSREGGNPCGVRSLWGSVLVGFVPCGVRSLWGSVLVGFGPCGVRSLWGGGSGGRFLGDSQVEADSSLRYATSKRPLYRLVMRRS